MYVPWPDLAHKVPRIYWETRSPDFELENVGRQTRKLVTP